MVANCDKFDPAEKPEPEETLYTLEAAEAFDIAIALASAAE